MCRQSQPSDAYQVCVGTINAVATSYPEGSNRGPLCARCCTPYPLPHTFLPGTITSQSCVPARSPLPSGRPLLCLGSLECCRPPYHGRAVSQWHPRRRPRVYCGGYVSRRATLASATDAAHLASITDTAPLRSSGWHHQTQIKLRKILISTLLTAAERTFEAFARLCLSRRLRPPSHRCTRL